MRFSVIVATLDAAGTVGACLESVLGQTWRDVEVIVADGGSSDGTLDVVAELADARCTVLSGPDRGVYDAWNKGLRAASGDWMLFLGADDILAGPEVLEVVARRLDGLGDERTIAYGAVQLVDALGHDLGTLGAAWDQTRRELRRGMALPNPGTFYRARLFEAYGPFDTSYRSSGDYEFVLRMLDEVEPLYLRDLVVTRMGAEGMSSEARSTRRRHLEDLRAQRAYGVVAGFPRYWTRRATIELRAALIRLFGRRFTRAVANAVRRARGRPLLPRSPGRRR